MENALRHWKAVGDGACGVARVSVAEVEWGLHWEANQGRWRKYRAILEGRLPTLETTEEVWREFSVLKARQRAEGESVDDMDLLIAATALRHGLTMATLNAKDFSRISGLKWEDWTGAE